MLKHLDINALFRERRQREANAAINYYRAKKGVSNSPKKNRALSSIKHSDSKEVVNS